MIFVDSAAPHAPTSVLAVNKLSVKCGFLLIKSVIFNSFLTKLAITLSGYYFALKICSTPAVHSLFFIGPHKIMVRTSDIVMYVIFITVVFLVIYVISLHTMYSGSLSARPPSSAITAKDSVSAPDIINLNIENILKSRPLLVSEPPIAEDLPYRPLLDVVETWNPDQPDIPDTFRETLQHFDYGNPVERAMAEKYRNAELPFKLFNVSDFHEVARLWTNEYLHNQLTYNLRRSHVERSKNNHFMYWTNKGSHAGYTPPTQVINMPFDAWLELALAAESKRIDNSTEHFYFMSSAPAHDHGSTFISRDLKLFSTERNNFFITNVPANKGIQCRFGMRGVIAESHYDSGRNMVAMLKGAKRYVLNPPWACKQLGIINDKHHPSYRHSVIDWSDMTQARSRGFAKVDAIDTVLRLGQVLYIPTYWFHYMVSLNYSIQCNSRSGLPPHGEGRDHNQLCMHQ